jgi:hypothetical protein
MRRVLLAGAPAALPEIHLSKAYHVGVRIGGLPVSRSLPSPDDGIQAQEFIRLDGKRQDSHTTAPPRAAADYACLRRRARQ